MVAIAKYQRVPNFGRNDDTKHIKACTIEQLNHNDRIKCGDYRKFYCFGLSLRYKKGVQFCSRYMKGVPFFIIISILKGKV